jgi:hypothetical protein
MLCTLAAAKIAETLNMNELSASGRMNLGDEGTENLPSPTAKPNYAKIMPVICGAKTWETPKAVVLPPAKQRITKHEKNPRCK